MFLILYKRVYILNKGEYLRQGIVTGMNNFPLTRRDWNDISQSFSIWSYIKFKFLILNRLYN